MSRRYDCSDSEQRAAGVADAVAAVRAGELVVIPTDTVYGIGADAFTPSAVTALLEAKGRGRDMPVAVLVGTVRAASALIEDLGTYGQDLIDMFWPGPLTIICRASRSLNWDLGDTKGTVAVRMPLHPAALELLKETGPMAVSSANRTGVPAATTAADAEAQLGESVAVYLDGGPCSDNVPSTIIDLTTAVPRVLRKGAVPVEKLRAVIGYVATDADPELDREMDAAPEMDTDRSDPSDKTDQLDMAEKSDLAEGGDIEKLAGKSEDAGEPKQAAQPEDADEPKQAAQLEGPLKAAADEAGQKVDAGKGDQKAGEGDELENAGAGEGDNDSGSVSVIRNSQSAAKTSESVAKTTGGGV